MSKMYTYELWNGKEVVGTIDIRNPIMGVNFTIMSYRYKDITMPVRTRVVSDDGVDVVLRRVLDVSRKGKRQIEFLKSIKDCI